VGEETHQLEIRTALEQGQSTVKEKGYFKQAVVTSVVSPCLSCGNQRRCTQVQPTLILLATAERGYSRREPNTLYVNMPLKYPLN